MLLSKSIFLCKGNVIGNVRVVVNFYEKGYNVVGIIRGGVYWGLEWSGIGIDWSVRSLFIEYLLCVLGLKSS